MSSSDDEIAEYFPNWFGGGRKVWIKEGRYTLLNDGRYSGAVRFLAAIRRRAAELLDRPAESAVPGTDYALPEVVRCKSRSEIGVRSAASECSSRYLHRTLEASGARVMVSIGAFAATAIRDLLGTKTSDAFVEQTNIGSRTRHVAFLPHPDYWGPTTFQQVMPEELNRLRSRLGRT